MKDKKLVALFKSTAYFLSLVMTGLMLIILVAMWADREAVYIISILGGLIMFFVFGLAMVDEKEKYERNG